MTQKEEEEDVEAAIVTLSKNLDTLGNIETGNTAEKASNFKIPFYFDLLVLMQDEFYGHN
jgi:hypothetical protein